MINYSKSLSDDHKNKLSEMIRLLDHAYEVMISNLENYASIKDITNAQEAEVAINECRKRYRKAEYDKLNSDDNSYFESVFFLDVLEELEKIGDYIINVSEALLDS